MKLLTNVIFLAVFASGYCLICQSCSSVKSCMFASKGVECSPEKHCYSITLEGEVFHKGCISKCTDLAFATGTSVACAICSYDNCNGIPSGDEKTASEDVTEQEKQETTPSIIEFFVDLEDDDVDDDEDSTEVTLNPRRKIQVLRKGKNYIHEQSNTSAYPKSFITFFIILLISHLRSL